MSRRFKNEVLGAIATPLNGSNNGGGTVSPPAPPTPPRTIPKVNSLALNMSGLEYQTNFKPVPTSNIPTAYYHYADRGMEYVRIPFAWSSVQPTLYGPLDSNQLTILKNQIDYAHAAGLKVLVDMHSYGYNNGTVSGHPGRDSTTPADALADLWSKMATALVSYPGVWGYDLINEPEGYGESYYEFLTMATVVSDVTSGNVFPVDSVDKLQVGYEVRAGINTPKTHILSIDTVAKTLTLVDSVSGTVPAGTVLTVVNNDTGTPSFVPGTPSMLTIIPAVFDAVTTAIRAIDTQAVIVRGGNHYSGGWDSDVNRPNGFVHNDPVHRTLFAAHIYPDRDSSGTRFDYDIESSVVGQAPPGASVSPTIIATRLSTFYNQLIKYNADIVDGLLGIIGEFGIPNTSESWYTVANTGLDYCKNNGLLPFIWAAGTGWGSFPGTVYKQCIEPDRATLSDGTPVLFQALGMAMLTQRTGAAEPDLVRLQMPPALQAGQPSSPCTLSYRGNLSSPITVTLTEVNGYGFTTSIPLVIPVGRNPSITFTVTPTSASIYRFVPSTSGKYRVCSIYSPGLFAEWDQRGSGALYCSAMVDAFTGISKLPTLQSSNQRLTSTWSGPVVLLRRATDNTVKAFYATSDSDPRLNRTEIANWAGSNTATIHRVVTYDQSGQGNHNYAINSSADGTNNGGYEPLWVLDNGSGYPVERRTGQRGGFNSSVNGLIGYTMIVDMLYTSGRYLFPYTSNTLGSIGLLTDNFGVHVGVLDSTMKGPNLTVAHGLLTDAPHTYTYRFQANTASGLQSWRDGAIVGQTDTLNSGGITFDRATCDEGWFRFVPTSSPMNSDIRNVIIANGALTDAELTRIQQSFANIYATAWPVVTPPASGYPPVVGMAANSTWTVPQGKSVCLYALTPVNGTFNGADFTLTDPSSLNIKVDILMSAANGTLSGNGLTQDASNPLIYHLAFDTAANIVKKLRGGFGVPGVRFTPNASGVTTTFNTTFTNTSGATTSNNAVTVAGVDVDPLDAPYPAPAKFTPIGNLKGFNMSGGEGGNQNSTSAYGNNFTYGGTFELDYFRDKGFGLIRLPMKMNRVQANNFKYLTGLASLDRIKPMVDAATANGQYIILDLHEYGSCFDSYQNCGSGNGRAGVSFDTTSLAVLCDFWSRIANKFKNYPNVFFGLMNEPHGGNDLTPVIWRDNCIAMVNAIRATGATNKILIPGNDTNNYANSVSWKGSQGTIWDNFSDPNFLFDTHHYLDKDNTGTPSTVAVNSGSTVLNNATAWARDPARSAKGFQFLLTEFGWSPNDNQTSGGVPSKEGNDIVQYMKNNSDVWAGWTYWLGGTKSFYKASVYYAGPAYNSGNVNTNTVDSNQMPILQAGI
jgi:endoglucanase